MSTQLLEENFKALLQTIGLTTEQLAAQKMVSEQLQRDWLAVTAGISSPNESAVVVKKWLNEVLAHDQQLDDLAVVIVGGSIDDKNKSVLIIRLVMAVNEKAVSTFLLPTDKQEPVVDQWHNAIKAAQQRTHYNFNLTTFVITSDEVVKTMMDKKEYLKAFYRFSKATLADTSVSYKPTYVTLLTKSSVGYHDSSMFIDYYNKMSHNDVILLKERDFVAELTQRVKEGMA